jgi:hypothetical protein
MPEQSTLRRTLLEDPEYWERQAAVMRNSAAAVSDHPQFREILEKHASDYDELGKLALGIRQRNAPLSRRTLNIDPIRGNIPKTDLGSRAIGLANKPPSDREWRPRWQEFVENVPVQRLPRRSRRLTD